MRIIKEGTPIGQELFRGKCHTCNCEIECLRSEMKYVSASQVQGQYESYYLINCPTEKCNNMIRIYERDRIK